jgi:type II secretory pathway component GspD/PulD (secretin)
MLAGLRTVRVKNAVVIADEATLKGAYPKEFESEYGNIVKSPDTTKTSEGPKTEPTKVDVEDNVKRIHLLRYQGATQVVNSLKEYLLTQKVTIVALPNTLLPNLAAAGNSGFSNSGGASTSTSAIDSRAKQVLLSGPIAAVQEAILVLQQMDIPRRQVEITVTIHDVANDALRDAGVTWDLGQTTVSEAVNGNANVGTFSRTGLSFIGTLKALETASKAKLLASPNISVMDGELGSILIGEKRRFPVVTGTTANGQFIYSTEEQNVGISLLVATDITDDGTVTLALNAQVSSILGFLQLNGGSYPQIATRESKSTLHLRDGQTMLMSGLLRDEEIVNLQKVPFLGQIPFFGELFKSRKTQKNSSQLLISITPHIIKQ